MCMYLANHLAHGYAEDQLVQHLMNNLEIVMVPFVNPDGYAVGVVTVSHDSV